MVLEPVALSRVHVAAAQQGVSLQADKMREVRIVGLLLVCVKVVPTQVPFVDGASRLTYCVPT